MSARTCEILALIRECKTLAEHIGELFHAHLSSLDFTECDPEDVDYLMRDFIVPLGQTKDALYIEFNASIKSDIETEQNMVQA